MYRDKINLYIDHINRDVLTKIRYMQLQRDYQTEEKVYVKSILNALHKCALEVYGEDSFGKDGETVEQSSCQGSCRQRKAEIFALCYWR